METLDLAILIWQSYFPFLPFLSPSRVVTWLNLDYKSCIRGQLLSFGSGISQIFDRTLSKFRISPFQDFNLSFSMPGCLEYCSQVNLPVTLWVLSALLALAYTENQSSETDNSLHVLHTTFLYTAVLLGILLVWLVFLL